MSKENFQNPPVIPRPPFPPDGVMPRYYPYHPEWPAGYWGWNDTEPASVGPWGCCPPHPIDDCICVTSADIDRWNSISALSGLSGLNLDALSSISGMDIPYSATLWNSCYETVYENSATWESAQYIPEMSAWTSAMYDTLEDRILDLSAHRGQVYTNKIPYPYIIEGDGTQFSALSAGYAGPLQLNDHVVDLLRYIDTGKVSDTVEHVRGGKPIAPIAEWIASKQDIKYLEDSYDQILKQNAANKASIQELWDTIKLILQLFQSDPTKTDAATELYNHINSHNAYWNEYWDKANKS